MYIGDPHRVVANSCVFKYLAIPKSAIFTVNSSGFGLVRPAGLQRKIFYIKKFIKPDYQSNNKLPGALNPYV